MVKLIDNILVTGGAGYIGSHIVEKLVKTNKNIFIFDNLSTGFKSFNWSLKHLLSKVLICITKEYPR